jgi:O-succinylbenzoate synthase
MATASLESVVEIEVQVTASALGHDELILLFELKPTHGKSWPFRLKFLGPALGVALYNIVRCTVSIIHNICCTKHFAMLFSRAMKVSVGEPGTRSSTDRESIQIDQVELRLIRLPLVEPFETSFGSIDSRLIFLVRLEANGLTGWGEVVASEAPLYSYETVGSAFHIICDFLAPAILKQPITTLNQLANHLARFKGHNMAKAGIELAFMDLIAQAEGEPLSRVLGGDREHVSVGVSLGIQPTVEALLERVDRYLNLGYQRIKLKIKPGWDVEVVRKVRHAHPDILLSVDANSAYTLKDKEHLKQLDDFNLLMIEQPLENDDIVDHAALQSELKTSICLDESITSVSHARKALELGSCRLINIKVGRVGGYLQALAIHDLCYSKGVPVWCGGMLESGIGRAHNIALASLPGFTLPGDISASSRYFKKDIIDPEVTVAADGTVEVPKQAGLGFDIDLESIQNTTEKVETITRKAV